MTSPEPKMQHSARVFFTSYLSYHCSSTCFTLWSQLKEQAQGEEGHQNKGVSPWIHIFEATEDNYVGLLKAILAKHGEDKKSSTITIDSYDEYKDLTTDILKNLPPTGSAAGIGIREGGEGGMWREGGQRGAVAMGTWTSGGTGDVGPSKIVYASQCDPIRNAKDIQFLLAVAS
ncbi:hypothetical protein B0H14DRAFT_2577421 [Mycena olivaceomarginata]|nr:hypothetical protein B0H14DRAFT_2577421 [Mycena olivaceomarginata]